MAFSQKVAALQDQDIFNHYLFNTTHALFQVIFCAARNFRNAYSHEAMIFVTRAM